eukprot:3626682-Rhodomonas_salina.1
MRSNTSEYVLHTCGAESTSTVAHASDTAAHPLCTHTHTHTRSLTPTHKHLSSRKVDMPLEHCHPNVSTAAKSVSIGTRDVKTAAVHIKTAAINTSVVAINGSRPGSMRAGSIAAIGTKIFFPIFRHRPARRGNVRRSRKRVTQGVPVCTAVETGVQLPPMIMSSE